MILERTQIFHSNLYQQVSAMTDYIQNNTGVFITFLYLFGSLSGIVYLQTLLQMFSLSAFDYIELSDFMLALIKQPALLVSYLIYLVLNWIYFTLFIKNFSHVNSLSPLKKFYHALSYPFYFLNPGYVYATVIFSVLLGYSLLFGTIDGENILAEKNTAYHVSFNYPVGESKLMALNDVQLITTTIGYVFIYNNQEDSVIVVPQHNIAALIPQIKDQKAAKSQSIGLKGQ